MLSLAERDEFQVIEICEASTVPEITSSSSMSPSHVHHSAFQLVRRRTVPVCANRSDDHAPSSPESSSVPMVSGPPASSSVGKGALSKVAPPPQPIGSATASELPSFLRTLDHTQSVSYPAALTVSAVNAFVRRPGHFRDNRLPYATPVHKSYIAAPERVYAENRVCFPPEPAAWLESR